MKIFHGYRNIAGGLKDPVLAIGIFDGIHIGHKRVITRMLRAKYPGRDKAVMTFDPHPRSVLYPKKKPPRIMSLEHRLYIFQKMGIDAAIVINFSEHLAGMTPEEFIKTVIKGVGARTVYVGGNFHFGSRKKGDTVAFKELGKLHGIDVHTVRSVKKRGKVVSSTWVRKLVSSGKLQKAEKLLRRPVSILGTVVRGDERGRRLGFPTANVDPHQEVIPPPGVYAVKIEVEGKMYDGVLNIGFRPTFYGRSLRKRKEPHIEVNIFDFHGHLYDAPMEIFFIQRLRSERKFKTEEDLIKQVTEDKKRARKLLESPGITHKIKKYKYL